MKNKLSHVLFALQAAIRMQPTNSKGWTEGVQVIEAPMGTNGAHVWWVRADAKDLLGDEQIKELKEHDLLENNGEALKKRFGRSSPLAYGVIVDKLRRGVQDIEAKATKFQILERKNKELESELKAAREANVSSAAMTDLIETMRVAFRIKSSAPATKFSRVKRNKTQANAGVPTLFCSDWHWGEVVDSNQIQHHNEYNLEIADKRADRVFDKTLELLFHHQSGTSYDAMVCALGGDMSSGIIHNELRQTNERPLVDLILSLGEKLAGKIITLAENFPGVYVPCVVGNHGRLDFKPTAKNAVNDNYDYLLYRFVEMLVRGRLGSTCNVDFDIAPGLDLEYAVYGTRYVLTHGDQMKGGTEDGDFWPNMAKAASRKQQRSSRRAAGGFDHMICGHFHKYGNVSNIIVNGSLKGYDEFAYKKNYEPERPTQALWITHPEQGITGRFPIYGDDVPDDETSNLPPIAPGKNRVHAQ